MCEHHDASGVSRRNFAGLALGAATLAAFPFGARAADIGKEIHTLALMCIDFRLVTKGVEFIDQHAATNNYDLVTLAGASLAGLWDHWSSVPTVWDQIAVAKKLHKIKNILVLDHRDCGAYKEAFGTRYEGKDPGERNQHLGIMRRFKSKLATAQPGMTSEYFLMAVDGTVEHLL